MKCCAFSHAIPFVPSISSGQPMISAPISCCLTRVLMRPVSFAMFSRLRTSNGDAMNHAVSLSASPIDFSPMSRPRNRLVGVSFSMNADKSVWITSLFFNLMCYIKKACFEL